LPLYRLKSRPLRSCLFTARRAAVLAYIANLLLRTIPLAPKEVNPDDEPVKFTVDFGDLPRPKRDAIPAITTPSQAS
jgi:hypothetical protein